MKTSAASFPLNWPASGWREYILSFSNFSNIGTWLSQQTPLKVIWQEKMIICLINFYFTIKKWTFYTRTPLDCRWSVTGGVFALYVRIWPLKGPHLKMSLFSHADLLKIRVRKYIFACGSLEGPHAKISFLYYSFFPPHYFKIFHFLSSPLSLSCLIIPPLSSFTSISLSFSPLHLFLFLSSLSFSARAGRWAADGGSAADEDARGAHNADSGGGGKG